MLNKVYNDSNGSKRTRSKSTSFKSWKVMCPYTVKFELTFDIARKVLSKTIFVETPKDHNNACNTYMTDDFQKYHRFPLAEPLVKWISKMFRRGFTKGRYLFQWAYHVFMYLVAKSNLTECIVFIVFWHLHCIHCE